LLKLKDYLFWKFNMEKIKFFKESRFKQTEIGEIPEDWNVMRLAEILESKKDIVQNKNIKPIAVGEKGVRFREEIYYKELTRNYEKYKVFEYGDLCFGLGTKKMAVGVNVFKDKIFCVSPAYSVFRVKQEYYSIEYFDYLIKYYQQEQWSDKYLVQSVRQGKKVDVKRLSDSLIIAPPLSEQKAIAYVLSTIQEAVEKTKKVIEATKELKKSLMRHLFTYGPVPLSEVDKVKLKETEIGEIPEDWKVVRLGEISNVKTSFPAFNSISELDTHKNDDEVVLALKVSDMNYFTNQKYINESQITFHYQKVKLNNSHFLRPESIIFPKRGGAIGTNKKRITKSYSILDPNLIGVEPSREVIAEYLFGFFEQFDLRSLQDNTPIPQLNKHQVESIMFPLPPLPIQQKIAEILSAVDEKIQAEEKKKRALENLFKSMLSNLMTGKIRVKELG